MSQMSLNGKFQYYFYYFYLYLFRVSVEAGDTEEQKCGGDGRTNTLMASSQRWKRICWRENMIGCESGVETSYATQI